ncbi:MAG TPA: Rieske (2Fe-2S) protein [Chitinophagaceae bacterium]|nr:Rieske (2Fe-2S) protein [Chitinophagaceae bacterium]
MERRKFISTLGAPMLAACAVCMASCSKSSNSPSASVTPPGSVNFSIDLNSQLTGIGNSLIQNGVIVVRLASGNVASSFTALQVTCTHQGGTLGYEVNNNDFLCPNHGSKFSTTGAVINGPAVAALKSYTINISGNTMIITG